MAQAITGSRLDQFDIEVTLDGDPIGLFDKMSGGEVDSEETVYKPGAMGPRISLGGSQTPATITLSRIYDLNRDHANIHKWLSLVGKAKVVIQKISLDADGNAYGKPLAINGRLKMVKPPEPDSEGTGAAMLDMEVTPEVPYA